METLYWILEYGKVFCGYLFLMFLWPSVVFHGHLKQKVGSYRFSFCVTVQIVIINTVVLTLGLFHILNRVTVLLFFYGVFFYAVLKQVISYFRLKDPDDHMAAGPQEKIWPFQVSGNGGKYKLHHIRLRNREKIWELRRKMQLWIREYGLLSVVLIFGMIYFSYGAFQVHSYGWGDLYAHHEWIYGLIQGNAFSGGVYPEAMHCFIYSMSMLSGIRVYSILLYLQAIHVVVFLLSVYLLMREVFHWKYSPILAMMLFLTLDVVNAEQVYALFRLQVTLPLEFGLHTQFLCALFLVRYLKKESYVTRKDKISKYCWDENLFLFMMALTASIATHFYVVFMAFILCASFSIFALKKIFSKKYFIPLVSCAACGCLLAIAPMAGALATGTPFNYSIDWAMEAMEGEETRQLHDKLEKASEEEETLDVQVKGIGILDWKEWKEKSVRFFKEFLPTMYQHSYPALYGEGRSKWIMGLTGIAILLCLFGRLRPCQPLCQICSGYPPLIVFTLLFLVTYAMPYAGYPELFPDSRFCSVGHFMILAVSVIPLDVIFSLLIGFISESLLKAASIFATAGIYVITILLGNYRGFLFYELTRYNSTVEVTNSIIEEFPRKSYTIVAPTDELYPVIEYGWHEELQSFVEECAGTEYTIPSEYVFIYVEKKPLLYAQAHFFQGPSWLGQEKYEPIYWGKYSQKFPYSGASQAPEIKAFDMMEGDTQIEKRDPDEEWYSYTRPAERTALESMAYDWCQRFAETYPSVLDTYYEDEDFVCYYFRQDADTLYNLCIDE